MFLDGVLPKPKYPDNPELGKIFSQHVGLSSCLFIMFDDPYSVHISKQSVLTIQISRNFLHISTFEFSFLLLLQKWREKCGSKQTSQVKLENSVSAAFHLLVCSSRRLPVRKVVRWLVGSFIRWFVGSLVRWFVGSFARSLARSLARSFVRSLVRSFFRSFVRSFARSFVCLFVCSFVRSVSQSLVRSFVRSFIHELGFVFIAEVSTTQPESSSEEEEERPSSPGIPSDTSDSDDEQGALQYSLLLVSFSVFFRCTNDNLYK